MSQRLNPERYAVHGEWCYIDGRRIEAGWRDDIGTEHPESVALITVHVADLWDKRLGHVWRSGAYKVTLRNVPGMRSKTFYGETAWSRAGVYASDAATKCGDWRWRPDL